MIDFCGQQRNDKPLQVTKPYKQKTIPRIRIRKDKHGVETVKKANDNDQSDGDNLLIN